MPAALRLLHKHGAVDRHFYSPVFCTCQTWHSLIKLVNTCSSPRLPTGDERSNPEMHPPLPILATHLGSLSEYCALFLSCHTANLSSSGNTALSYYLWGLAFWDATQAGIPIELSCRSAPRPASWAKHLHFCSPGRVLSSSWGSVGVIYSPFKQPLCIHCTAGAFLSALCSQLRGKRTAVQMGFSCLRLSSVCRFLVSFLWYEDLVNKPEPHCSSLEAP